MGQVVYTISWGLYVVSLAYVFPLLQGKIKLKWGEGKHKGQWLVQKQKTASNHSDNALIPK